MIYLAIAFALINRLRGHDFVQEGKAAASWAFMADKLTSRPVCCLMFGACVTVLYCWHGLMMDGLKVGGIVAIGTFLWCLFGWGKGFPTRHAKPLSKENLKRLAYMSAVGLRALPLFAALAWMQGNLMLTLWGLPMCLMGVFYHLAALTPTRTLKDGNVRGYEVEIGEVLTGALMGALLYGITPF